MSPDAYEAVIGLEVHTHLLTKSKLFCGCSTAFGAGPNENVCPVCMAMPGVLARPQPARGRTGYPDGYRGAL